MRTFLARILIFLLMGTASAWAQGDGAKAAPAPPDAQDMKVIAVMEILQMLDMTEEMEMIKEMEYLVEDDQNESKTN